MKFGLFGGARTSPGSGVGDSQTYHKFLDYVQAADDLGYAGIFLVEHHFTGQSQVSASLNLLAYLAARTRHMRLGTAVIVLPWHNPVLLAEQVATVDLLSNGRVDFGVGKGYRDNEFESFCIPKEEATERFDECMEILRKAWSSKGRFSHHGKRWHFENIVIDRCRRRIRRSGWARAARKASRARAARASTSCSTSLRRSNCASTASRSTVTRWRTPAAATTACVSAAHGRS
jgi:alkanesulfonate monooxygenase SsuD/methylene tetrahydromethanopterin reductase-like flavin-dependent oxidoreductase (luciferase family)